MAHTEWGIVLTQILPLPNKKGSVIITYEDNGKTYEICGEIENEASMALALNDNDDKNENFICVYYILDTNSVKEIT